MIVALTGTLMGLALVGLYTLKTEALHEDIVFFGDSLHSEKQQAFMQFLMKYGRTYASKHDYTHRFETFSKTYDKVMNHNSNTNSYVKLAINEFADMTVEEFDATYINGLILKGKHRNSHAVLQASKDKKQKEEPKQEAVSDEPLPEKVDWHAAGKVS